ncbi:aminodeoxychorismate synthase component I [Roseibium sp.]|uniref:aminodeoxychorismate synthase component I n=1 Tax=Roseibium sp. TaxID=1936156 RepID=UPI003263688E
MTSCVLENGSVLLLDCLREKRGRLFVEPQQVLACLALDDVASTLNAVDEAVAAGFHVAGFLAYELGYAFEEKLRRSFKEKGELLAWFGIYREAPQVLDLETCRDLLARSSDGQIASLGTPEFDWSAAEYEEAFREVQEHLAQGNIYQVNLTLRARFAHKGPPEALLLDLLRKQPVAHAAYLKLEDRTVLSLSPELFLERKGDCLRTRPMKGTAPRGRTTREDERISRELSADPKQRAENTMIVDLMRNDLSRIAEPGSVNVTALCDVERYKSLHQMTSTVEARVKKDVRFSEIIERLFPCGSITGAPKLSAMMIADRLETSPRGVYTGSIGFVEPSGDFNFNVAIRTLVLKSDGQGEVGTGSGVIFDSGATPEYDECRLKLKFLSGEAPSFSLFETMAFAPSDGFLLLERHLARLSDSADYFGFQYDERAVSAALKAAAGDLPGPTRLKVQLSEMGQITISHTPLSAVAKDEVWDVVVGSETCHSSDVFLYHKTTNRTFYDEARAAYAEETGCQEVLFLNENGFLTEGSFTNLFLKRDGKLLTPAIKHGLLPGTLRAGLLERGMAAEADLTLKDLQRADEIYAGNSVRGLVSVRLIELKLS